MEHKIMYFVKEGRMANFSHAIAGILYYHVSTEDGTYEFSVNMNDTGDVGSAIFPAQIKAITLMRYVRKALEKDELYKVKP